MALAVVVLASVPIASDMGSPGILFPQEYGVRRAGETRADRQARTSVDLRGASQANLHPRVSGATLRQRP
ncbi:hypothetical protein GCM10011504_18760 [Siccirubricoccus deserti]|nr:hypothetical protein GCM10011504_18760 [Siccirubricoccus deserti]